MIVEIVLLVVLAAGVVILKIFQSESERKRRLDREEEKLGIRQQPVGFRVRISETPSLYFTGQYPVLFLQRYLCYFFRQWLLLLLQKAFGADMVC